MAIKNIFGRGVGFTDGQVGWVVTRGYGDLTVAGGSSYDARMQRNRRYVQVFSLAWATLGVAWHQIVGLIVDRS